MWKNSEKYLMMGVGFSILGKVTTGVLLPITSAVIAIGYYVASIVCLYAEHKEDK